MQSNIYEQRILGENLYRLRIGRGLSQESVADAIGVSRQSVSKWETGGAVPELDKLILLAQFFGVSLDELVQGSAPQSTIPASTAEPPEAHAPIPHRKIIGTILLCTGAVIFLLLLVFAGLGGLFFALPFLLCGLICLLFSRRIVLWCAWAVYFSADLYLQFATGVSRGVVWLTHLYTPSMNYGILVLSWIMAILFVSLIVWTVVSLRKWRFFPSLLQKILLGLAAAVFCVFQMLPLLVSKGIVHTVRVFGGVSYGVRILMILWDWCSIALFVVLLVCALGMLRGRNSRNVK